MNDFLLFFFIYSFFGWLCECIYCSIPEKHFINRGFLEGPYCPVYGFGAMLVLCVLLPFSLHPLLVFLLGVLLTSALEYMTGWLMEVMFHTRWWDYSAYPFNLHGRICLKNSLLFGVLVMLVCYIIHPLTQDLLAQLSASSKSLVTLIITVFFLIDCFTTLHALLRKNADFAEIEDCLQTLRRQFRKAELFPLNEPLSLAIKQVLDSTDADELLLAHIEVLKKKLEQLRAHQKHTLRRLKKAFPNHKERRRELLDKLTSILEEHRR